MPFHSSDSVYTTHLELGLLMYRGQLLATPLVINITCLLLTHFLDTLGFIFLKRNLMLLLRLC